MKTGISAIGLSAVLASAIAIAASAVPAFADENGILARADGLNDEGKELFSRGELEDAASKFRAAIALSPQARYYFNLCFLLNARGELEAALGACAEVEGAEGSSDRLRKRTDTLIASIEKKRARTGGGKRPPPDPEPPKPDPTPDPDPTGDPPPPAVDPNAPPPITTPPGGRPAYPPPIRGGGGAMPIVTKQAPGRRVHIGGVFGLSSSTLGETFDSSRAGVAIGGFVATPYTRRFGSQIEVLYIQRGGSDFFNGGSIELNYLSFPVLGKFHLPLGRVARLYLESGLAFNFLLDESGTNGEANAVDVGFIFGGGLALHRRGGSAWTLSLRREQGLGEVGGGLSQANSATTLVLGYAF